MGVPVMIGRHGAEKDFGTPETKLRLVGRLAQRWPHKRLSISRRDLAVLFAPLQYTVATS